MSVPSQPRPCEWCYDAPATGGTRGASTCLECRPRAERFFRALEGNPDASWLPKAGEPWLTLHLEGKSPTHIKTFAPRNGTIRTLLPKPPKAKRKTKADISPAERLEDLAKRPGQGKA